jgi:hypothetical protein
MGNKLQRQRKLKNYNRGTHYKLLCHSWYPSVLHTACSEDTATHIIEGNVP